MGFRRKYLLKWNTLNFDGKEIIIVQDKLEHLVWTGRSYDHSTIQFS